MSYCLNPDCQLPENPNSCRYCQNCGTKLLLRERYRAIKPIGQGGFGKTFLAVDEDKPSKPYCVIKQFFPMAQGTGNVNKAATLFDQEAIRLDQLGKNPQIPELLAHFTQDSQQYLVLEYIEGQNLAQALSQEGIFTEKQIRELLKSLLPVLQFIHGHNVIHRDIKPENIIRKPLSATENELVLVDFGAAKYASHTALMKTGTSIGTPEYIAPEQTRGKATFSSDLYGLGVTCLHLLTKISPFELFDVGENTWIWRRYLQDNTVSLELGRILDKLVENAINRRYQSAQEVIQDLRELSPLSTVDLSRYHTIPAISPIQPLPAEEENINLISLATPIASPVAIMPELTIQNTAPQILEPLENWQCVKTLNGHHAWVTGVAVSPNSKLIASGSEDFTVKLWLIDAGVEYLTLRGHGAEVTCVAFSPDGNMLASGSKDKTIKLWDAKSGKLLKTLGDLSAGEYLGHAEAITSIAFSPFGNLLVSGSRDKLMKIWWLGSRVDPLNYCKVIYTLEGHDKPVRSLAINIDGETLASGGEDNMIKLWQLNRVKGVREIRTLGVWYLAVNFITALAFSPDGKVLASGGWDKNVKIWDVENGNILTTMVGHTDYIRSVAFHPQGEVIASGSDDRNIKVWDVQTGRELANLSGHSNLVNSVVFTPKGDLLVSGSSDNSIKIWQKE